MEKSRFPGVFLVTRAGGPWAAVGSVPGTRGSAGFKIFDSTHNVSIATAAVYMRCTLVDQSRLISTRLLLCL